MKRAILALSLFFGIGFTIGIADFDGPASAGLLKSSAFSGGLGRGGSCPGGSEPLCTGCSKALGCVDSCNGWSYCACAFAKGGPRKCRTSPAPVFGGLGHGGFGL
jgi:hypothetical protein